MLGFLGSSLSLGPQSAWAICTTEQEAAHCGANGTGVSFSFPPTCTVPAGALQMLITSEEAASVLGNTCSELPWLPQLQKTSGKGRLAAAHPTGCEHLELHPVLLGFWCRCKEVRAEDVEQGNVKTKISKSRASWDGPCTLMSQSWLVPWVQKGANLAQQRCLLFSELAVSRSLPSVGGPAKALMLCEP